MTQVLTGLRAWVVQRISGAYLAVFIVYLVLAVAAAPPRDYAAWVAWMSAPAMVVATGLFFVALLYHAWIGVRDVILDYIHPLVARAVMLGLVMVLLLAQGIWVAAILAEVAAWP